MRSETALHNAAARPGHTPEDMLRLTIEWAYVVFRKDEQDALRKCFDFNDATRKKPEDDDFIPY
ncbi:hypothetical protein [Leisingera sp. M658]|uniref:hypothetical protein n=1 Tax=Leisingera sp. M658 TaxID=2867015 RepID=UPI0021A788DA|nr:hypothetical protein [Leisingera sp. M658]UWQ73612.1 hypothetical protein K3724_13760 [Leisingera sp. M658]